MAAGETIFVDYARSTGVASMMVGGMTVAERVLREAAQSGAARAIVRGDALPPLPPLPLEVELVPSGTLSPPGAVAIEGDVVAGVRISDAASRRAATRALLQTCRRPHDGIGDRYVIRAISLRITSVLCRLGATPNQVTWVNIAVGLAACAAAARGAFAVAGALMFLQVVLDSSDGELARLRHLHSRFGMWLDNTSDDLIDNLFIAALGVGLGGIWAPIGIAAAAARGAQAAMIHIDVARRGKPGDVLAFRWWFDREDEALAERFDVQLTAGQVLRSIGRRDLYVLAWSAGCLAGVPVAALGLGAVLAAAQLGLAVVHVAATRRAARARRAR
jgi:phosphatidylglycerophosphate synthase